MKYLAAALFAVFGIAGTVNAESPFRIEKVKSAFEEMRLNPEFDTIKPLQWGFFFIAEIPAPLDKIQAQLKKQGYKVAGKRKDEEGTYWLELSKTEVHTPETLHKRNQDLFQFAKKFRGASYDGWDVTRQQ